MHGALVGFLFRSPSAFERELLGGRDFPPLEPGVEHEQDVLRHHAPGKLLEIIHRDGLGDVGDLGVPRHDVAEVLSAAVLRDAGVPGEEHDDAILAPDLAGQHVLEDVMDGLEAGVLVVDLDDFLESELAQGLSHGFPVCHRRRQFGGDEIVVDAEDDRPGFVVEPLGAPKLRINAASG